MYWLSQPEPELCVSSALQLAFAHCVQLALLEPVAAVGLAWHEPGGGFGASPLLQASTDANAVKTSNAKRCRSGIY
jgi:hypothetical protein